VIDNGGRVESHVVTGWWIDTGNLEALLEGNRLVLELLERGVEGAVDEASRLEGRVVVSAGASVVRSTVRGPAVIGAGARIEDSYIGPFTSIGTNCEVVRSEVSNSVVLAESRIVDVAPVEESLIGRQAELTRSGLRPQAHRLMIGDHSRVDLSS
jgi:glucose-1-phosphate thymidylyltransferase